MQIPTASTPLSLKLQGQLREQTRQIGGHYFFIGSSNSHWELEKRGLAEGAKAEHVGPNRFRYPLTPRGVEYYETLRAKAAAAETQDTGGVGYWLKLGYWTDSVDDYQRDFWDKQGWVSDGPGRKSPRWNGRRRPRRGEKYPPFGPQYAVGDRLVVYVQGYGCPALLEVSASPRWDPDYVDRHSAKGEGDEWGVVTATRGLGATTSLTDAPSLTEVGIPPRSVMRKGHVKLAEWNYRLAERQIAGTSPAGGEDRSRVSVIPVEQGHVEGYDVRTKPQVHRAERREASLVRRYVDFLQRKGDVVGRIERVPIGGGNSVLSDIYNETRGQLVEAKAAGTRNEIRMAIGQLADYRRGAPNDATLGVLIEARPAPDLMDLLAKQNIAAIWPDGDRYADTAGGSFT